MKRWTTASAVLATLIVPSTSADIITVCQDGTGDYMTISEGYNAATNGDQVIVCDGVYTGPLNAQLNFSTKAIVLRSANGPENCVIDCGFLGRAFEISNRKSNGFVLNGFTIVNGRGEGAGVSCRSVGELVISNCIIMNCGAALFDGGGIYSSVSTVTIIDCVIVNNSARDGGGFYGVNSAGPIVIRTLFQGNGATNNGGGLYSINSGEVQLVDCTFEGNAAGLGNGGGVYVAEAPIAIESCTFRDNMAELGGGGAVFRTWPDDRYPLTASNSVFSANAAWFGGAVALIGSPAVLVNCEVFDNLSYSFGGGLYTFDRRVDLINCSFAFNTALTHGGGIDSHGDTSLLNSILWSNTDSAGMGESAQIHIGTGGTGSTVDYSCVEGWTGDLGGTGNIGDNPMLVDVENGDFHLLGDSPCIDTGDPNFIAEFTKTDIDGQYRIWNNRVDMGADEFGSIPVIRGDMNCDHALDGADIDVFFLALGDPAAYALAYPSCDGSFGDMNDDGVLDGADIDPFFDCLGFGVCP